MIFGSELMAQKFAKRSYVDQDVVLQYWQIEIGGWKVDIGQDGK